VKLNLFKIIEGKQIVEFGKQQAVGIGKMSSTVLFPGKLIYKTAKSLDIESFISYLMSQTY